MPQIRFFFCISIRAIMAELPNRLILGSTATAIFGALEPVTAIVLSVAFLGQSISGQEIAGGLLIIIATTIVVTSHSVDKFILHVRKMFPKKKLGHK